MPDIVLVKNHPMPGCIYNAKIRNLKSVSNDNQITFKINLNHIAKNEKRNTGGIHGVGAIYQNTKQDFCTLQLQNSFQV